MNRLIIAFKSIRHLGLQQVFLYARHRFLLHAGLYKRVQPPTAYHAESSTLGELWLSAPTPDQLQDVLGNLAASLIIEADRIVAGQVRLFGGSLHRLQLIPKGTLHHWSFYETHTTEAILMNYVGEESGDDGQLPDLKFVWEPARFGWAFTLGRAYRITREEAYARAFWQLTETFLDANTPFQGPHWISAQEVALRIIAWIWACQVFAASPLSTPQRRERLALAVAQSAARIPSTLGYARAQRNNHLLSEAAGLYSASLFLPQHPEALRWRELGWYWFNQGLQDQIDPDGAYIQHSSNYHRLTISLALWMSCLARTQGQSFPNATHHRLVAATRWLLAITDHQSGRLPNLGPNDGSLLLPLTSCPIDDFRPCLQAAASEFLAQLPFSPGPWDETRLWVNIEAPTANRQRPTAIKTTTPHVLHHPEIDSWAYFRIAHFSSRPGHADQLHIDLWWHGMNVAQDAGTYLYNAPPPWDNSLAAASVHNTLTINNLDQMTRAGRFLFLDWAQAQEIDGKLDANGNWQQLSATHDGYRRLGAIHRRSISPLPGGWLIDDTLLPTQKSSKSNTRFAMRLHWLLPDWPWQLDGTHLTLADPSGKFTLQVTSGDYPSEPPTFTLVRAGEKLAGNGPVTPVFGWFSPTYGIKIPALSASFTMSVNLPATMATKWTFHDSAT